MAIPYDESVADQICDEIASSSKGLAAVIRDLQLELSPSLIYKWLQQNSDFRERYARARSEQARVMAEEIAEIADSTQLGEVVTIKADGSQEIKQADMIEHRKLRIEARKWLAAKLLPKVYGDKMALTGDGGGAIQIVSSVPRPKEEE